MPAVSAELRACFDEKVSPPPPGRMTQEAVYNKFGEFIVLDRKKTSCGKRLIARDDMLRQKSVTPAPR